MRWDRTLAVVAAVAFLLTAAGMVRWYAAPQAGRLALDPDLELTASGTGRVWDPGRGAVVAGPLREQLRIAGDRASGSAAVAVWQVERRLTRPDGTLVRLASERVALDRRTAAAVACCGEQPRHAGLTYAFPPGTDRSARDLYDPATGAVTAVRYAGEDAVGGLAAYRMEQVAGPVERAGRTPVGVPATLSVTSRRTLWVDPVSGTVLRVRERRTERAAVPGRAPLTLLDVTRTSDPATTDRLAARAADRGRIRSLLRTTVPLGAVAVALLTLVGVLGHDGVTARRRARVDVSRSSDTRW